MTETKFYLATKDCYLGTNRCFVSKHDVIKVCSDDSAYTLHYDDTVSVLEENVMKNNRFIEITENQYHVLRTTEKTLTYARETMDIANLNGLAPEYSSSELDNISHLACEIYKKTAAYRNEVVQTITK